MEIRSVTADEFDLFMRAAEAAFHEDVAEDDSEMWSKVFEPERSLAAFEGPEIVATTAIFTRELTIPGAVMSVAGVTAVGVLPTHRRRGLLTQLMRRQLDDVRAAREPVAALWASEQGIYGRFGYGLAAEHASVTIPTTGMRVHPDLPEAEGRMVIATPADAVERIAPLYDRVRRERVGHLDRAGAWWERRVRDPERYRDGRNAMRAAIHETPDGEVDAYVLYAVKSQWHDGPDATTFVRELVADGPAATAAAWSYVLGLDLTRKLEHWPAPPDLPFADLLRGPSRAHVEIGQNLWIRLVDVSAALEARTYAGPIDVVLEVDDAFCPWNAGRHHLRTDGAGSAPTCRRTDAPAGLALSAADLGAAYLGGTSLAALAAIGRVRELRPGVLEPVANAFRIARAPWCPEIF
jgi:predicted acetyltransferase